MVLTVTGPMPLTELRISTVRVLATSASTAFGDPIVHRFDLCFQAFEHRLNRIADT